MGLVNSKYEHPPSFEQLERHRRASAPGRLEWHTADNKEDNIDDDNDSSSHVAKYQLPHDRNKRPRFLSDADEPMPSIEVDIPVFANHPRAAKRARHDKTVDGSEGHHPGPSLPAHKERQDSEYSLTPGPERRSARVRARAAAESRAQARTRSRPRLAIPKIPPPSVLPRRHNSHPVPRPVLTPYEKRNSPWATATKAVQYGTIDPGLHERIKRFAEVRGLV